MVIRGAVPQVGRGPRDRDNGLSDDGFVATKDVSGVEALKARIEWGVAITIKLATKRSV